MERNKTTSWREYVSCLGGWDCLTVGPEKEQRGDLWMEWKRTRSGAKCRGNAAAGWSFKFISSAQMSVVWLESSLKSKISAGFCFTNLTPVVEITVAAGKCQFRCVWSKSCKGVLRLGVLGNGVSAWGTFELLQESRQIWENVTRSSCFFLHFVTVFFFFLHYCKRVMMTF